MAKTKENEEIGVVTFTHQMKGLRPKKEKCTLTPKASTVEAMKDLKFTDFALENIVAANATQLLQPSVLDGSIDDTIAGVGRLVNTLESIEIPDNNEVEN